MQKTLEENVHDLIEIVANIQENMATKDDLKNFATKDDLKNFATKDDLREEMGQLRLEMQAGFREIHSELDDIKASLDRLEKKTQEDNDAVVYEVEQLKKRVRVLEESLRELENQKMTA